jgi:hypothetical protein
VYRYSGSSSSGTPQWEFAGGQEHTSQVYSFCVLNSELFCGTWPDAKVFRRPRGTDVTAPWIDCGRAGKEKEIMGMAVRY